MLAARKITREPTPIDAPVYTLLIPLHGEAESVPRLAEALRRLDYPKDKLDKKLVLEADDHATIAAAQLAASDFDIVLVPPALPRTKPKALNFALARAKGEFVAVYDAEDDPHPQQLLAALRAFHDGDSKLGVVQAPLLIDNGAEAWIARQFELEYALHFLGVIPLMARLGLPVPLGGTSNHFRVAALRDVGGWDPFNVTEDADLGYRLARRGWRIGAIAPPTYEEAPVRLVAWVKQRSRWIKGYAQTWLVHMRHPADALSELGPVGFASMQVVLAGGVVASLVHGPLALWAFGEALALGLTGRTPEAALMVAGYASAVMGALAAGSARVSLKVMLAGLTTPFYWPLSSVAALKALIGLVLRPHHWDKTAHGRSDRNPRWTSPSPSLSLHSASPSSS